MSKNKILKNFDTINFRKHLLNLIDREQTNVNKFKNGETVVELREYVYHCGRENALAELLEDMNMFAEFEKDKEENKNEQR